MLSLHLNADTSCQPLIIYTIVINSSFCGCLRYVENFWDSINPSSLSLIALDAQEALFSSPLERHFV